jgi:CRP-like cAMP-binding protein
MGQDLVFEPNEIVCRMGDKSTDLLFLQEGLLLICTVQGTQVKALDRIEAGEFIGELSFFDENPRSSHIVALEKSTIVKVPREELISHLPFWFIEVGKNLTKKIRLLDQVVQESNIKKISVEDQRPLSIEEQRKILETLNKQ